MRLANGTRRGALPATPGALLGPSLSLNPIQVSEEHLGLVHRICGVAEGGDGGEVGGGEGSGDTCALRVLCVRAVPLGLLRAAIVVCERCAAADSDAVASAPASAAAALATPVAPVKVPTRLPWETKAGRAGWDALRKRDRPPMVPAALSRGRDPESLAGQPGLPVEGVAREASMNLRPSPAANAIE